MRIFHKDQIEEGKTASFQCAKILFGEGKIGCYDDADDFICEVPIEEIFSIEESTGHIQVDDEPYTDDSFDISLEYPDDNVQVYDQDDTL